MSFESLEYTRSGALILVNRGGERIHTIEISPTVTRDRRPSSKVPIPNEVIVVLLFDLHTGFVGFSYLSVVYSNTHAYSTLTVLPF